MSTYRIATEHDIALGSLTVLNPQPRSSGVQPTRRTYTGNGIIDEALYVELIYDVLDDAAQYQAVLTAFGLMSLKVRDVTIYARNDLFQWTRYNGRAIRPEPVWEQYFPRNMVILVTQLQDLA